MELAAQFARRSAAREEIGFEQLTLHSDNGGPMKGPSNVRAKRATTAGRQARAGENVPRTTSPGLVACRWRAA